MKPDPPVSNTRDMMAVNLSDKMLWAFLSRVDSQNMNVVEEDIFLVLVGVLDVYISYPRRR